MKHCRGSLKEMEFLANLLGSVKVLRTDRDSGSSRESWSESRVATTRHLDEVRMFRDRAFIY